VRLLTFTSSTRCWCELHEEAFRRLGGTVISARASRLELVKSWFVHRGCPPTGAIAAILVAFYGADVSASSFTSASALSSPKRMSISRNIAAAVARCTLA